MCVCECVCGGGQYLLVPCEFKGSSLLRANVPDYNDLIKPSRIEDPLLTVITQTPHTTCEGVGLGVTHRGVGGLTLMSLESSDKADTSSVQFEHINLTTVV